MTSKDQGDPIKIFFNCDKPDPSLDKPISFFRANDYFYLSPDLNYQPGNLQGYFYQIVNRVQVARLYAKIDYKLEHIVLNR